MNPAWAAAAVRAQAARALRIQILGFVLLLSGSFLALTAIESNGFVVVVLLRWAVGPFVAGSGLTMLLHRQTEEIRRSTCLERGETVSSVLRPRELRVVDEWSAFFGVLGLLGFVVVVLFTLPVAVAAASLDHPTTTTVLSASVTGNCGRCHTRATATFQVSGRTVTAQLAAPSINEADTDGRRL